MTLTEVLITLAIFVAVMIAVVTFDLDITKYQASISGSYQTEQDAQIILKTMLTELREMAPGADGSYALVNAGSTTISFFSDPDNDGVEEQITYSLSSTTLYKAVIQPSGTPPVYNQANQSTTTILVGVQNGIAIPVFQYFDQNYNGTSSPLTQPVTTASVHLIKANLTLLLGGNSNPAPVTYTVQASLRNLKTNL